MLILISPAKTIDTEVDTRNLPHTDIVFPKEAQSLVNKLKVKSPKQISKLMTVSPKLAELNTLRFQEWKLPFEGPEAKQALLVFKGEVYQGMNTDDFKEEDFMYAQDHLGILSGLYGYLRPLDKILPYRLEMGTKWSFNKHKNVYSFWGTKIQKQVVSQLKAQGDTILINLASNEYYKAVNSRDIKAQIITPEFKDFQNGKYKTISFFAKKARGKMTSFILKNRIENPEELKSYTVDGYLYSSELSTEKSYVFTREP